MLLSPLPATIPGSGSVRKALAHFDSKESRRFDLVQSREIAVLDEREADFSIKLEPRESFLDCSCPAARVEAKSWLQEQCGSYGREGQRQRIDLEKKVCLALREAGCGRIEKNFQSYSLKTSSS